MKIRGKFFFYLLALAVLAVITLPYKVNHTAAGGFTEKPGLFSAFAGIPEKNPDGVTYRLSEDKKRITLYWGEKPTGGYDISITSVEREGGALKVFYALRSPGPNDMVTQAITYPMVTADLPEGTGDFAEVLLVKEEDINRIVFTIGQKSFSAGGRSVPVDAAPFIEDGRAYVPVRYLALALGVPEERVIWSPSARTVTLFKGGITVSMAPGGNIIYINDVPQRVDAVPLLREGRVYLPARYIAEAMGYEVEWDGGRQAVIIRPAFAGSPETAYGRMSVGLYAGDSPEELSSPGSISAGQKVMVLEKGSHWALVQAGPARGWLPRWYLSENNAGLLPQATPCLMVVKGLSPVYLYPEKEAPEIGRLEAGKVVRVEYEAGDWRYVHIVVYSIPAVLRGWVPRDCLAAAGEAVPMEGRLPRGTVVYPGDGPPDSQNSQGFPVETTTYDMRVYIVREKGEMAYVASPGGWSAWVFKKDIVFNPF